MHTFFQDCRHILRRAMAEPVLILTTIFIVVFGVGINTSVFSLIHTILAPTLPYDHAEQLVEASRPVSGPVLEAMAERPEIFSGIMGWYSELLDVNDGGSTTSQYVALVSGGAFKTLRVNPALGRMLEISDDQPEGGQDGWKCVLSYAFWKGHFNGNESVVGTILKIDGHFVTIVGVAQRNFDGIETGVYPALYLPSDFDANVRHEPNSWALTVIARLQNGTELKMANGYFQNILDRSFHDSAALNVTGYRRWELIPLSNGGGPMGQYFHQQYRLPLLVLQALAVLILLLCCISLAWLFSSQIAGRQKELSVRMALGATRWHLWRPILLQQFLLSGIGMAGGLVLASWISSAAATNLASAATGIRIIDRFDFLVFACAGLAALGSMILSTVLSMARVQGIQPAEALKHYGGSGCGPLAGRWLKHLLAVQTAISAALTVGALLLGTTLFRLLNQNLGFSSDHVLSMQLDFTAYGNTGDKSQNIYRQLFAQLPDIGEIRSFSIQSVPILRDMHAWGTFNIPTSEGIKNFDNIYTNTVGANYFRTLGTRIVKGREFQQKDRDAVILNQSAVHKFFSGGDAIGKFIFQAVPGNKPSRGSEVVGVVQDSKYENIRNDAPATIYSAYTLSDPSTLPPALQLVVRTERSGIVEQRLHEILKKIAPDAPLSPLIPYQHEIMEMTARERLLVELSVLYSLLSLLMTAAGVYGTLSHHARQRTSEVGLRFALGASRGKIVQLFVWQIFVKLLPGVMVGLILGFVLGRSISSLLFGVDASSPWIYGSCLLLILTTIASAIYGPIRRASLMEPMQALRLA